MRRLFALALCVALVVGATGCGIVEKESQRNIFIYDAPPMATSLCNFGLMLPEVAIDKYWPGAVCVWPFALLNGNETAQYKLSISLPGPDQLENGYVAAPAEVVEWLMVGDMSVVLGLSGLNYADAGPVPQWVYSGTAMPELAPCELRIIPIALVVPVGTVDLPQRWQFMVKVLPASSDFIVAGVAQKCLVSMSEV
jgi:hypothetical protein